MATKTFVKLKAKDQKKEAKPVEFEIGQANKLLKLSNSQWELSDDKFQWNGIEIAKK